MRTRALIVAHDERLGIGKDNKLPWHIKEDMKFFRDITTTLLNSDAGGEEKKNVVIMGRKTWESLPDNYKPLPKRINLVLSRNPNYNLPANVIHSSSIPEALATLEDINYGHIFVIGGGNIYQDAIKLSAFDTLYVTEIKGQYDCDVFFPEYRNGFELIESSPLLAEGNYHYYHKTYKRKR